MEGKQDTLVVTIVQTHLHWENAAANLKMFSEKLEDIDSNTDLIVLPEMFTTGFSMNASRLAQTMDGEAIEWMISEAKTRNSAITGSIIISENGTHFNRLLFVFPDGTYQYYDKRHTFTLAGEHKVYAAGSEPLLVQYKGWRLFPLICYDLRFPVWARNTVAYDVLLYVANWPKRRVNAWDALLKARAIENMCYTVGVNRVGLDGNGHEYTGHSAVYDVLGDLVSTPDFEKEFIETVRLEKSHIDGHRKHLQFLQDRDDFTIN